MHVTGSNPAHDFHMSGEPDLVTLDPLALAVARAIDPVAFESLERIEATNGRLPAGLSDFRTLSHMDWQRRVAWAISRAPHVIQAFHIAHAEGWLRILEAP